MSPSVTTNGHSGHHVPGSTNGTNGHENDINGHDQGTNGVDNDHLEPIAVVGFSLKFPQDASSTQSFWNMLVEGRSAMTKAPKERFNIDSLHVPNTKRLDELPSEGAHFLEEDIGAFDAGFFNISPLEASAMDPMQRMLLETTYRALENAGLPIDKVAGSSTSVYTGCFTTDYLLTLMRDPQYLPTYGATGTAQSFLANRLSWFFDFKGPSVNLDSACSSSGMALDWACTGLRDRSCNMSVVGGCNLTFAPEYFNFLTNMSMLSHSSRSFSFDSRANGYSRGEGIAAVILKRLDDAIADEDTIRGIIRSTGCNQDGRTPGITQPSSAMQERLILETYRKAGLSLSQTLYCEAHGTGTALGDPTEAMALGCAFKKYRSPQDPMMVGSLKSNIGHLEGAAGIAGLIKAMLCLERGIIPPIADFQNLNPKIDAEGLCLAFPASPIPWPSQGLRRASINSFGFGGSNSHVVIDDAYNYLKDHDLEGKHCTVSTPPNVAAGPPKLHENGHPLTESPQDGTQTTPKLCVLSAANQSSLTQLTKTYAEHFQEILSEGDVSPSLLDDLAHTLGQRRTHLLWRSFLIALSSKELGAVDKHASSPSQRNDNPPRLGFIFTGQGAQWYGMGRELMAYPIFASSVREADAFIRSLGSDWSALEYLSANASAETTINVPTLSQTLCTVLQVALVELLEHFGVTPSAVAGHSSGEIAAAYAMGALSKESAWKAAYYRGLLATTLSEKCSYKGGMLAVALSAEEVAPYFEKVHTEGQWGPVVACHNSPKSITVSGTESQIDALAQLLNEASIFNRKLVVPVAYHSPQMAEIAGQYLKSLNPSSQANQRYQAVGMVSSVTGQKTSIDDLRLPQYWVDNMVSPVQFSQAVGSMCAGGSKAVTKKLGRGHRSAVTVDYFLEIGPHGALKGPVREILRQHSRETEITYDSVLTRNVSALDTVLNAVGRLHCSGYNVNLRAVNEGTSASKKALTTLTDLPEYQFDHSQKYWHESRITNDLKHRGTGHLELLGRQSMDWNPLAPRWRNFLRTKDMPWIEDHKINGVILYPGAGMLVMAIEAARRINAHQESNIRGYQLNNVHFSAALDVSHGELETQISLHQQSKDNALEFVITSYTSDQWTENCRGTIRVQLNDAQDEHATSSKNSMTLSGFPRSIPPKQYYDFLSRCGYGYGSSFQRIQYLECNHTGEATAEVSLFEDSLQPHTVHPATLDAIMHLEFAALSNGLKQKIGTHIPTKIGSLWLAAKGLGSPAKEAVKVYSRVTSKSYRYSEVSCFAMSSDGQKELLRIEGAETTAVATATNASLIRRPEKQGMNYMDTKIDVELVAVKQTVDWLSREVPSIPEPAKHRVGLRNIVFECLKEVKEVLGTGSHEDAPQFIKAYIAWMDYQLENSTKYATEYSGEPGEERPAERRLYEEAAKQLLNVLTQKMSPTQLLFESNLLNDYYLEKAEREMHNKRMLKYVDLIAHKNPAMKIIEIGGGTGTYTGHIMDTLQRHSDGEVGLVRCASYEFTDIGPYFVEQAKDKFAQYAEKMQYGILDIEKSPETQGYEAGSYDMVVAIGVLHATRSLEETLRNARMLLKPGGTLLLQELVTPLDPATGFPFGVLPGWWLSTEENRKYSPLVDEETWDNLLQKTGFNGTEIILRDHESKVCHEQSVIFSKAIEENKPINGASPSLSLKLIVQDGFSVQQDLATQIQTHANSINYACEIITLQAAAAMADLDKHLCIFIPELEHPFIHAMSETSYDLLKAVLARSSYILWLTKGGGKYPKHPSFTVIDGFGRSYRLEAPNLKLVSLALEDEGVLASRQVESIFKVLASTQSPGMEAYERELVEIDGMLHTRRIVEAVELKKDFLDRIAPHERIKNVETAPPISLNIEVPGQFDTIHFTPDSLAEEILDLNQVEVEVKAIGLEYHDFLVASGRSKDTQIGSECCGTVRRAAQDSGFKEGDSVWMHGNHMCRTIARSSAQLVTKLPQGLPLETVPALPPGLVTVSYALHQAVRIRKGDTLLIRSSKMLQEAAVQMAIEAEVNLYVVATDEAEHELLGSVYRVPEERILSPARLSSTIKKLTGGKGVDMVLNGLEGDMEECLESMSPFGTLVDIMDHREESPVNVRSYYASSNITYMSISTAALVKERPQSVRLAMEMIASSALRGTLKSRNVKMFQLSQTKEAFEQFRVSKDTVKVVLNIDSKDEVKVIYPQKPTYKFDPNASYVITGGLGGLGRSYSLWMARKGAKHLILLTRSGAKRDVAKECVAMLNKMGVQVAAPPCDVSSLEALTNVLRECEKTMPPVKGCIHMSTAGKDAVFDQMPYSEWLNQMGAKTHGAWNLHQALPKGLDFFMMGSSVGGILGGLSLVAYSTANSYLDGIAKYRISQGEKAMSMDFGPVENVGRLAELQDVFERFILGGKYVPLLEDEILASSDRACDPDLQLTSLRECQPIVGVQIPAKILANGFEMPESMRQPLWYHMLQVKSEVSGSSTDLVVEQQQDLAAQVDNAASVDEEGSIIALALKKRVASTVAIDEEKLDIHQPMHTYGVDSLTAVDLRNWFTKKLGVDVAVFEILGDVTFTEIGQLVAKKYKEKKGKGEAA